MARQTADPECSRIRNKRKIIEKGTDALITLPRTNLDEHKTENSILY